MHLFTKFVGFTRNKVIPPYFCMVENLLHEKFPHITLLAPTPQNGQTHSSNSSAFPDELFECV